MLHLHRFQQEYGLSGRDLRTLLHQNFDDAARHGRHNRPAGGRSLAFSLRRPTKGPDEPDTVPAIVDLEPAPISVGKPPGGKAPAIDLGIEASVVTERAGRNEAILAGGHEIAKGFRNG